MLQGLIELILVVLIVLFVNDFDKTVCADLGQHIHVFAVNSTLKLEVDLAFFRRFKQLVLNGTKVVEDFFQVLPVESIGMHLCYGFHGAVTLPIKQDVFMANHAAFLVDPLSRLVLYFSLDNEEHLARCLALCVNVVILVESHRLQLV